MMYPFVQPWLQLIGCEVLIDKNYQAISVVHNTTETSLIVHLGAVYISRVSTSVKAALVPPDKSPIELPFVPG